MTSELKKVISTIIIVILIISITMNVVFFITEKQYIADKKIVKESVKVVEKNIDDLDKVVSTNMSSMDEVHNETIEKLIKYYMEDENFQHVFRTNYNESEIRIDIGEESFITTVPNDVESLQKLVYKLRDSNNELNRLLLLEKNNRTYITKYIKDTVVEIRTNIQVVYEKVDNFQKPKTWSFSVGIQGGWNGRYNGIDSWTVAVHGLVYFKNKVYGGAYVGVENYMQVQPSVGIMLGWKIN